MKHLLLKAILKFCTNKKLFKKYFSKIWLIFKITKVLYIYNLSKCYHQPTAIINASKIISNKNLT